MTRGTDLEPKAENMGPRGAPRCQVVMPERAEECQRCVRCMIPRMHWDQKCRASARPGHALEENVQEGDALLLELLVGHSHGGRSAGPYEHQEREDQRSSESPHLSGCTGPSQAEGLQDNVDRRRDHIRGHCPGCGRRQPQVALLHVQGDRVVRGRLLAGHLMHCVYGGQIGAHRVGRRSALGVNSPDVGGHRRVVRRSRLKARLLTVSSDPLPVGNENPFRIKCAFRRQERAFSLSAQVRAQMAANVLGH